MYDDLYDQGYGAGANGSSWVATVAGRPLTPWQRSELASGWWAGRQERAYQETRAVAERMDWSEIPL